MSDALSAAAACTARPAQPGAVSKVAKLPAHCGLHMLLLLPLPLQPSDRDESGSTAHLLLRGVRPLDGALEALHDLVCVLHQWSRSMPCRLV